MTHRQPRPIALFICGLALTWSCGGNLKSRQAVAASPESAPAELTSTLEQMATAATAGDVSRVMQGYSPEFTNDDGFTYETLPTALETLWQRYSKLTYRIELQSWEQTGDGYRAETVTYIDGTQLTDGRATKLESVIRSEQTFIGGKIVSQKTLSERNQRTSGDAPPTISVILPEQVGVGESYDFDAIVAEPLGSRYLLGAAVEEGATAEDFFTGRPLELELLTAGGLFKVGEAPATPDSRWVSALLVRDDGIVVVTRRLRVE
ncbi:MAG: nuclear transport factor 2 family protein [Phormidesmis sp.]